MPGWIDIQIIGDSRGVTEMLRRIDQSLSPVGLEFFMKQSVEPWLQSRARDRFQDEGDDAVGTWEPLKQSTVMIRGQRYGEHPINRRTGELEDYITQSPGDAHELGSGAVLVYPGNKASGELLQKVETAQRGKPSPSTVPRPVLGMNETDLAFVLGGLAKFIQGIP